MRLWILLVAFSLVVCSFPLTCINKPANINTNHLYQSNSILLDTGDPPQDNNWFLYERNYTWNKYYNVVTHQHKIIYYDTAVNYKDKYNLWHPINTSFEYLNPSHPAYQYGYRVGNTKGVYSAFFKPNIASTFPIAFAYNKSDDPTIHVLRSQLLATGYIDPSQNYKYVILQDVQSSQGYINGNTGTYPNVFTGVNLSFRYDNNMLKEDIYLSNQTRSILEAHPPSSYGLNNANSYLVYVTKLDYHNLYPYVGGVNQSGNFSISSGSIDFMDKLGKVRYILPLGSASEVYGSDSVGLVYRLVQYQGNYYLFAGVKVSSLASLNFPIVIDPTVTLTYTSNPADVQASLKVGAGRFPSTYYELMTRWDISSLTNDASIIAINYSYYHLYVDSDGGGTTDADVIISKVNNQTWGLPSTTSYNAMTEKQRTNMTGFNDSDINAGDYVKVNVTYVIQSDWADHNLSSTFRLEDYDYQVASNSVGSITNTTLLWFGNKPGLESIPPSSPYVSFASREYATTSQRPSLEVIFYATINLLPSVTGYSPLNHSKYIIRYPQCSVTVTDPEVHTMNVSWYNSSNGVTYYYRSTNHSVASGSTAKWTYSMANNFNTDYWWKVKVNDGVNNVTFWYNFTTASSDAQEPDSFTATTFDGHQIDLAWIRTSGSDKVYIERNATGYVVWTRGQGIEIYNDTGATYSDVGLNYNTHYYYQAWGWNDTQDKYSDENASDDASTNPSQDPVVSNPNPTDGSYVNIYITVMLSADINDPEGNPFSWTIETVPDVGSNSGYGYDGTMTCTIALTQSHVTHTWWVNASDGLGGDVSQPYTFTPDWYPEQWNEYPINESINKESTPTLRITIDDQDHDLVDVYFRSNYSNPAIWTILGYYLDVDISGGPVEKTCIATALNQPDRTYWWKVYLDDDYGASGNGANISIYHYTTCSVPSYSSLSPVNKSMIEKSPIVLNGYFSQPQGLEMNITWTDYESTTILGTNMSVFNGTHSYSWSRYPGTGEWYVSVICKNFTDTSAVFWFANNNTWDDDFNNSFLVGNTQQSSFGLAVIRTGSQYTYYPYYNNSVAGGKSADVTIESSMRDASYDYGIGPTTVFTNSSHGYTFCSRSTGGNIWGFVTDNGGASWTASYDAGLYGIPVSVWYDNWTYALNESNTIHLVIGAGNDIVYRKFWTNNNTYGAYSTVHSWTSTTTTSAPSITVASNGEIWVGYQLVTPTPLPAERWGYVRRSLDGGVTWETMITLHEAATMSNPYYAYFGLCPLDSRGVMVLEQDENDLYAIPYYTTTQSWGTTIYLGSSSTNYYNFDYTNYMRTGDIYVIRIDNDISATADIYLHRYHAHNDTWDASVKIKDDMYTYKPAIAISQGNGDLYIAFGDGAAGAINIYSSNSTDGGTTWSTDQRLNTVTSGLWFIHSNCMSYDRIFFTWTNDGLNDLLGCTVRTYNRGAMTNDWANVSSIPLTKPTGSNWTSFNLTGIGLANMTFYIYDSIGNQLFTSHVYNNNISSITADTIILNCNLSKNSSIKYWNVSYTEGISAFVFPFYLFIKYLPISLLLTFGSCGSLFILLFYKRRRKRTTK